MKHRSLGAWSASAFPAHHVHPAWIILLLIAPPIALARVPLHPFVLAMSFAAWLATAPGLAIASLLDWCRINPPTENRATRALRKGTRVLIAVLGGVGTLAGLLIVWRATSFLRQGAKSLSYTLAGVGFGAMVLLIGAQLAVLPYRRMWAPRR